MTGLICLMCGIVWIALGMVFAVDAYCNSNYSNLHAAIGFVITPLILVIVLVKIIASIFVGIWLLLRNIHKVPGIAKSIICRMMKE